MYQDKFDCITDPGKYCGHGPEKVNKTRKSIWNEAVRKRNGRKSPGGWKARSCYPNLMIELRRLNWNKLLSIVTQKPHHIGLDNAIT